MMFAEYVAAQEAAKAAYIGVTVDDLRIVRWARRTYKSAIPHYAGCGGYFSGIPGPGRFAALGLSEEAAHLLCQMVYMLEGGRASDYARPGEPTDLPGLLALLGEKAGIA